MKRTPVTKTAEAKLKEEDRKIRSQMASQLHTETVMQKYCDVFENELKHEHLKGTQKSITDDIIVTVVILRPFNAPIEAGDTRLRSLHPYWKFLLRGETSLTDFHSLFRCSADFGISIPNKDETPELYDFNFIKYPSSFIFIHDTFYVPHEYRMSAEASQQIDPERLNPLIDISEPIRDWMKKKKHDFGPTKMQRLGDFKIIDLECRLGCPYVYIHQGCCEHVFYFTDLRLMDVQDFPGSYPHKISDTSIEHYCIGCCRRVATWIVENETFPVCPARMCDECYRDYHFVHTHRRKLPVKAYPYSDPSSLQF
ncbi:hypothetical protein AB6A40_004077 [Gnathostoma spinigerum]|uniref:snRNA-activating protein complex subunit 3 n=1 Tax=Gnathostoma spinigerum TaxID=75299 RepID=A0ABD6EK75_9BILA